MGAVGPNPRYQGYDQWLERVIGDSMDRVFAPGDLAHVVDGVQLGYVPRHNDFVVVASHAEGKTERSIKQVEIDGARNTVTLWNRSSNPRWDDAIVWSRDASQQNQNGVEIVGLVIGSYRPLD